MQPSQQLVTFQRVSLVQAERVKITHQLFCFIQSKAIVEAIKNIEPSSGGQIFGKPPPLNHNMQL